MEGFVPAGVVARLKQSILPRAFQTEKDLGNTQSIVFTYDRATDGGEVEVGPYEVLVKTVGISGIGFGSPVQGPSGTTSSISVSGEFQIEKGAEFNVHRGYRFCLDGGVCGKLTSDPLEDIAVIRVPF